MITEFGPSQIFGPVEVGHVFVVGGKTIDAAIKFDLCFSSGRHKDDDIQLAIMVNFRDDSIFRNSRLNGKWREAEIDENLAQDFHTNPLISGEFFRIYILMGDDRFHIALNGRDYCFYKYRTSLSDIHTISLKGDIQIVSQVDHRRIYPSLLPMIQFDDRRVVFSADVPRLFTPGNVIVITGIASGNPNGNFIIKFFEGPTKKQAYHMNARFQTRLVVLNSMNDALEWRKDEERYTNFPFVIDQQFKIAIGITKDSFKMAVDGLKHNSYQYRTDNLLGILTGIKISTDMGMRIEITSVDHHDIGKPNCEDYERLCSYD